MKRIIMVGNTHFDPVWLWRWDEAMASIRSTFRSALERMKEDENFCYSFSAPSVFEWIKNTDPGLFEKIKGRRGLVAAARLQQCKRRKLYPTRALHAKVF